MHDAVVTKNGTVQLVHILKTQCKYYSGQKSLTSGCNKFYL